MNSHESDCRSVGVLFFPIVFSTGGAIHPKSLPIIERIAELKAGRLGMTFCQGGKKQILHRIGVGIQKGNAYCIHSHMASALQIAARRKNYSPAYVVPEAIQDDAEGKHWMSADPLVEEIKALFYLLYKKWKIKFRWTW